MHMHEIIADRLSRLRSVLGSDTIGLEILETGTIRQDTPEHRAGDGWSTLAFAQDAQNYGGQVTSIDLWTGTAAEVLQREGVADQVVLRQGYSVHWMAVMLAAGQKFDVILLDSENDDQLILHEFMIAMQLLRRPGLILVDDVVPGSDSVIKGRLLVPWIQANLPNAHVEHFVRTGGGVRSGVLSVIM